MGRRRLRACAWDKDRRCRSRCIRPKRCFSAISCRAFRRNIRERFRRGFAASSDPASREACQRWSNARDRSMPTRATGPGSSLWARWPRNKSGRPRLGRAPRASRRSADAGDQDAAGYNVHHASAADEPIGRSGPERSSTPAAGPSPLHAGAGICGGTVVRYEIGDGRVRPRRLCDRMPGLDNAFRHDEFGRRAQQDIYSK